MTEFIITTPEQLQIVVSQTVENAFKARQQAQSIAEPTNQQDNDFLTRKQAAKLLGVSLVTLNEWSKRGVIIGYRIATRVRYKKNELEKSLLLMQTKKSWRAA